MNTRKNRKRTWKVQEQESDEIKDAAVETQSTTKFEVQQDSNRLLLFLQSWQEAKEAQINGTLRKDMPESIAELMSSKGMPISVNVARTKIMNFIKKYNFVKKMGAHGKSTEWTHFNTVKKILEFGPPTFPSANVVIPIENIKSEEDPLSMQNTLKIAERKISIDAQKSSSSVTIKKDIDVIGVSSEDTHNLKPRVYFSESDHMDDSDDSDLSDEDLHFENPLDKISFGFHNKNIPNSTQDTFPTPKKPAIDKNIICTMPALKKLEPPHIKTVMNPKLTAPPSLQSTKPIEVKQQIIPIPKNVHLPSTMNNGSPQQYLIVRPLVPGNQTKTLAIPMGGQFKFGGKPEGTQAIQNNAQVLKPNITPEANTTPMNNLTKTTKNLTKTQTSIMANNTNVVNIPLPSCVNKSSNAIPITTTTNSNVNGQSHVSASPCSSPGSEGKSPSIRQLLTNVIQLETNVYNLQQERLQLERERFEMERDFGKEMLNIFKEIKDKLCDVLPVQATSATTTLVTNVQTDIEQKKG